MIDLITESILDSTIQFQAPLAKNLENPNAIFLTGATGFLGAYLLYELMQTTKANVYCLIRCSTYEDGMLRLKKHLQFYTLWRESYSSRIIPIKGNLTKPLLGIPEQQFNELAAKIEVIYHSGAQVNAARPYSVLKTPNVLGTQEILRLASLTQTKPVHFVSTVAVFFSQAHSQTEIKEIDSPDGNTLKGGYRQTKWVAEQLVITAQERGLPANIYRAGRILGHSKTGIFNNLNDLLCLLIKGCIQMKKIPELDIKINFVPVDYISQAIIHLSQQSSGKSFHLLNNDSISWQQLFNNINTLGYSVDKISSDEWLVELKKHANQEPKDKLYSMLLLMMKLSAFFSNNKPRFKDFHNTSNGLVDSSIVCPPLDTELLSTYFAYFQKIGYIKIPANLNREII